MIGERKSPYTIKEYMFLVSLFLQFVKKEPENCTPADIERFKRFVTSEKRYTKTSQYLAIKAIKFFFKSRSVTPPINLTAPKRPLHVPSYLNENEARMLITSTNNNLKTHLIVSILAYTGIRVGELCRLNIQDVDMDEGIIHIRSGKGDRDRIVIMPQECKDVLHRYLLERYEAKGDTEPLILTRRGKRYDSSSIERLIKHSAQKAGINKKVTPHVLRHTFATSILRNGGDIRFIQQILGHASVATTQIYTHVDESMLREMYEKHKPKY
jgi:integrase/recombinase XerD